MAFCFSSFVMVLDLGCPHVKLSGMFCFSMIASIFTHGLYLSFWIPPNC
uniref:Uncharacterized protein n=1 Tax=Rhizophora mucronata TaxID=61149 RepID=A0A2P2P7T2_RHIMU